MTENTHARIPGRRQGSCPWTLIAVSLLGVLGVFVADAASSSNDDEAFPNVRLADFLLVS